MKEKIQQAMIKIEQNMTLSFHHYAKELKIPAQMLQEEWAKYAYKKRRDDAKAEKMVG